MMISLGYDKMSKQYQFKDPQEQMLCNGLDDYFKDPWFRFEPDFNKSARNLKEKKNFNNKKKKKRELFWESWRSRPFIVKWVK